VLQHPPAKGDGDVVGLKEPPDGLLETTSNILSALDYSGPFELEFVFDARNKQYKVIELNPRFWLQHGLVESVSGCAPVARYIGCEPLEVAQGKYPFDYWIHTPYGLLRLARGDLRALTYLANRRCLRPVGVFKTLRILPRVFMDRILKRD
jgi:hypothetical protein